MAGDLPTAMEALHGPDRSPQYSATSIPPYRRRRHGRDGLLARSPQGSGIRSEERADLPQLEPLRPRRGRRAPQAGGSLRQGQQLHGAGGHHGAPADAGQDRGRGSVAVGPRHVPDRECRSVPLREPPRQPGRPGRQARQGGRRLVSVRGGELPDQVRLEGDPLVLGVVPGHLQHGSLQEGGVRRSAEDVGRPPEDGQGAQEAGQPGRHPDQPLLGRPLDLLVGGVVLRGQGPRGRRQDPGDQLGQDGPGHRVVQGALQGRDGAGGPLLGRRREQSLHPLREGLLDPQSGQPLQLGPRQQATHSRRPQSSQQSGGTGGHPLGAAQPEPRHLEVLQEPGAGQGAHRVPVPEAELRRLDRGVQRFQPPAAEEPRRSPDLGAQSEVRHAAQGSRVRPPARLAGQAERGGAAHRRQLHHGRHGRQGGQRHAAQAGHGLGAGAGRARGKGTAEGGLDMAVGPSVLEAAGVPGPGRLSRLQEWWEQEHVFGYGLIVPAIVLLVTLVAFPFGMAIYFSLSDYWVGSPGGWVGLQNYRDILANETFRQTVQNSFVFTGIALTLKVVLGVWLAMLLARNLRFKRLIRGVVLLPFVIPTALSTLAWLWMFDSLYSVVNWTAIHLRLIDAPGPNWLGPSPHAMAPVIVVNVWRGLPFFAITVLAGLMAVPREFLEAVEVDGANSWGRFWHVTLPLIKPVLAVVILFSTIFTFRDFNIVQVLTRGGPINTTHLFATLAYQVGLRGGNLGQGAAISLFIFPLLALVVFFQLRYVRRE